MTLALRQLLLDGVAHRGGFSVDAARADSVLKRFSPRRVVIPIGGRPLSLVLPDTGALIRTGAWATEGEAEPPYWQEVWPASVAAARSAARLCRGAGIRVLDLGCGLGVPGIAAARAGCAVTFADRDADALAFVRWNLASVAPEAATSCVRIDWSHAVVDGQFDVVIMSDVSYRPVHHLALWRHVDACLAPDGLIIHSDPERRESHPFVSGLHQRLHLVETRARVLIGTRQSVIRLCLARRLAQSPRWAPKPV